MFHELTNKEQTLAVPSSGANLPTLVQHLYTQVVIKVAAGFFLIQLVSTMSPPEGILFQSITIKTHRLHPPLPATKLPDPWPIPFLTSSAHPWLSSRPRNPSSSPSLFVQHSLFLRSSAVGLQA